ncbi:MerR family transcriptional regulator [Natronoglycomyces albus]|uniref:MerR family transcriptional regulator n=1 Tax=Natronoglycomyces albus TaxID=2811108 RepID=A0A895XFJ5_9ACTN|nr:MerR family transcriptional regulator [Natronoglycomyces albus]QSB04621.1 MerR family transcriptional regulator [Natronoglycomyces albus]
MRREPFQPETDTERLTVGRLAALVGVSVRTLHHWDDIGLVRPSNRTWAGYRVYSDEDVARIHRVLVYRELGFILADIKHVLDDPNADVQDQLRKQRSQLVERISRLQDMVGAVDRMMEASATGIRLSPEEQVEIFGNDWDPAWADQAEERWGGNAQWKQYAERAANRTREDWKIIATESHAFNADLVEAKRANVSPGSAEANALAERHRAMMSRHFDCTHAMQVCLGHMFAEEPGYTEYYDALGPGLTLWFHDVIRANAQANGVDPDSATWE